jgi:hypothetical protein
MIFDRKPKTPNLRDHFAMAALTGLLSNPGHLIKGTLTGELEFKYDETWYANQAYLIAEAMIYESVRAEFEEGRRE